MIASPICDNNAIDVMTPVPAACSINMSTLPKKMNFDAKIAGVSSFFLMVKKRPEVPFNDTVEPLGTNIELLNDVAVVRLRNAVVPRAGFGGHVSEIVSIIHEIRELNVNLEVDCMTELL